MLLVIREVRKKLAMSYHLTPVSEDIIKQQETSVREDVGKLEESLHMLMGRKMVQFHGIQWLVKKLEIELL